MSAVMGFGPREENEAEYGAAGSPTVWLFCMFAVGWLSNNQKRNKKQLTQHQMYVNGFPLILSSVLFVQ